MWRIKFDINNFDIIKALYRDKFVVICSKIKITNF